MKLLRNKLTGWYRSANGGKDTSSPKDAVRLTPKQAARWICKGFRDYEVIDAKSAKEIE